MATCEFGKQVKKILVDLDMTQVELAKKIGTSPRYLGFIISGYKRAGKYEAPIRAALGLGNEQIDTAS